MSDRLLALQHAVKTYLTAQEFFSNSMAVTPVPIEIVCEDVADPATEVDKSLAQAAGMLVYLKTPGGKIPSKDNAAPVYDPAYLVLRIYENPLVNRNAGGTLIPGCTVADAIERFLWTFHVNAPGGYNPVVPISRAFGVETIGAADYPFYDVYCETTIALDASMPTRAQGA